MFEETSQEYVTLAVRARYFDSTGTELYEYEILSILVDKLSDGSAQRFTIKPIRKYMDDNV